MKTSTMPDITCGCFFLLPMACFIYVCLQPSTVNTQQGSDQTQYLSHVDVTQVEDQSDRGSCRFLTNWGFGNPIFETQPWNAETQLGVVASQSAAGNPKRCGFRLRHRASAEARGERPTHSATLFIPQRSPPKMVSHVAVAQEWYPK